MNNSRHYVKNKFIMILLKKKHEMIKIYTCFYYISLIKRIESLVFFFQFSLIQITTLYTQC